jgi:hypothetical protein
MKVRKLLYLNSFIVFIFFSCSEKRVAKNKIVSKTETVEEIENNIEEIKDDTNFTISVNQNDTINEIESSLDNRNNINIEKQEPKPDPHLFAPKQGTFYILDPKQREIDSIVMFDKMYKRLNNKLINKGINNVRERDSIIWDDWQKQISENDYRHKKVPFSVYWEMKNKN